MMQQKSIDTILLEAVEIEDATERESYLDRTCGSDAELRRKVEKLIDDHFAAGDFLEEPLVQRPENLRDAATEVEDVSLDFLTPSSDPGVLGRLGEYTITEVIGRGGMGIVLKGHDRHLNRTVAIKILAPELSGNATARKRFVREAQAAAAIVHQHVITIHAVHEDRLPYLVMEYVHGESLQERIHREGPLELKEILRIGTQVASGLAAAHAQGLIHRDVKPANIMLENGVQRVRLTDFGLARAVDDVGITRTGEITGTPQFMSPEQAQGKAVDTRSDLFSLGSVLYAMCTGRSPFRAETTLAALRRVCDDVPRPVREVNADIPEWLREIIDCLLQKDPDDRIQSASEVAELLSSRLAHLQDPNSTPPSQTIRPFRKPRRMTRHRLLVASAAFVMFLVTLGLTEATGVTKLSSTVLRIFTGEGTLVIEVDDPSVAVSLDGEELTIKGAGMQEFRLRPGQYRFIATKDGQSLKQELVTITRGDRQIVRIELQREAKPEASGELLPFDRHRDSILRVGFSADGRKALSLGFADVFIWEVASGKVLHRFKNYERARTTWASCGCFFPKGPRTDWVVIGGQEPLVRVYDTQSGEEVHHFESPPLLDLAVTPNSQQIVALTTTGEVIVWNVQQQREEFHHDLKLNRPRNLAISENGTHALTSSYDGITQYWEINSGKLVREFQLPQGDVAFVPGRRQAVVGRLRHFLLVDLDDGSVIRRFSGHPGNTNTFAVTPDGSHVISGGNDGMVRVWRIDTGTQIAAFAGHQAAISDVAVSPEARQILSGTLNPEHLVRLWPLPESVWNEQARSREETQLDKVISGDAKPLPHPKHEVFQFEEHAWTVWRVRFSPDGQTVLSLGGPDVLLWDVSTGEVLKRFEGFDGPDSKWARCGCFLSHKSPGDWIVVAGNEGVARVFAVASGKQLKQIDASAAIVDVAATPDGKSILLATSSGDVVVSDVPDHREASRYRLHSKPVRGLAVALDGRHALTSGYDHRTLHWDVSTGEILHSFDLPTWADVAFTPSGNQALVTQADAILVIDLKTGATVRRMVGHQGNVNQVTVTRDGRHALSVGNDRLVRVWDLATGEQVTSFTGHTQMLIDISVSPDGRLAASASNRPEAVVRVWKLPKQVWSPTNEDGDEPGDEIMSNSD